MSESTTATAGGRRFWVVVLCFAVANAATWVGYIHWQRVHRHSLLEVTQFTPGDGSQVEGRPSFCWSFNLDVAPAGPKDPPPGTVEPGITGKWIWSDPRTLRFTPDGELPRATPISATLNTDAFHTVDGFRLSKPYVAKLKTPALEVMSNRQVAFDEGDRVIIELTFNDKVLPTDVHHHLTLHGLDGSEIRYHPHGDAAGRKVRVITDPVTHLFKSNVSPKIEVQLSKGLTGSAGPLGLESDYHDRLTVAPDLVATEAEAFFPSHDDPFLQIRFNNSVDVEAVKQVISVTPAVPFTISSGYAGIDLHGPFQPGMRYAIKLIAPPAGMTAKRLPRPTSLSVLVPDRDAGLWFESEVGYLSAAGNRTVLAHAVNMTDLRATVTRVYDSNLVAWRNDARRGYWRSVDNFARPVAVQDIHLPNRKNEKQDIRLSLDELLPAGEARDGVYRILLSPTAANAPRPRWAGDDADDESDEGGYSYGNASTMVTLSDIGLAAKQGKTGVVVWATSLRTAQPLEGVHARIYSNKSQLLGDATTDANGLATIIPLPAGPGEKPSVLIADQSLESQVRQPATEPADATIARRASARLTEGKGTGRSLTWLDLRESAVGFGDADVGGRAYLRHGFDAFVYTDRGVYRAGETVHLRAIVRGADDATPPRFPVRWQIRRPDLHDWKAQMAEIDVDGATSFDLPLPTDLPSGRWTAQVGLPGEAGTTARFFGSVAFDVEDFMPQRMKVSVDFDGADGKSIAKSVDRTALGDDPIGAHVQADYLFGRPVAERTASLVVRVDPVPFQPKGFKEWTFGDEADTAEALGHARPLGRRAELSNIESDADGHAKWDIDVAELIENGEIEGGDAGKPILAAARQRGSRRTPRHSTETKVEGATDYCGPWRLSITGSVTETGGRAVTAGRQIDLDRQPYYIGLKSRETSLRPGVSGTFEIQLITPAGAVASVDGPLEFTLMRETWNSSFVYENQHYRFHSTRILEAVGDGPKTATISNGHGEISIAPPAGGAYVLIARDAKSHCMTSLGFYAGYGAWEDNISRQNPEKIELLVQPMRAQTLLDAGLDLISHGDLPGLLELPSRAAPLPPRDGKLHVGHPAQVIVRSPFAGRLLLSIENDGVVSSQTLEMPASHMAVPIEISEACRPNAFVTATVIRAVDPNAAWTIHRAIGVTRLVVDNSDRKLNIQLAAPAEILPQASLGVQLRVLDSTGNPVGNAAVTVAAVDEGICQLTDFKTPDPFSYFTAKRALGVHSSDLFGQLMPETPEAQKQSAVGGDDSGAFGFKRGSPVGARRVRPVALVSGVLHTDAQGIAHADFPTPEFSGQLRVMAVASAEKSFGSAEVPVLVRSPLFVQSSWPRFAAPGDRFTVPLTIFNNSNARGDVTVTIRLTDNDGPLRLTASVNEGRDNQLIAEVDPAPSPGTPGEGRGEGLTQSSEKALTLTLSRSTGQGHRKPDAANVTDLAIQTHTLAPLTIQPGGQQSVAFDVIAEDHIGVAHARLVATMGNETYEENIEIPVRPASPTITDGAYLTAKPDAPAQMQIPAGFVDGTVKYELRVSTSQQLQLPEGLDYLDRYPYGCLEQTTSTLFPLAYLSDIGPQISPGLFDKARVADKVQVGMLRLLSMQTSDGGLSMWPGGRDDWEWGSVYAAHFLVEAQAAGFDVPEDLRDPLLVYLRTLLNRPEDSTATIEVQAYAAYVLSLAGKPPRPVMERLSEVLKNEDAGSARFNLAAAWLAAGRRDLAAELIPAAIPAPRNDRDLGGNVGSGIRDRAVLISTMLAVDPDDARLAGLVQQLADSGRAKQWRSTQDTAFAVMAIGRYLRHVKSQTPYETAELLLEGKSVATAEASKPLVWTAASLNEFAVAKGHSDFAAMPAAGSKLEVRVTGPANAVAHVAWLEIGVRTKPSASADSGMTIRRRYLDEHGKPLDAMRVRSGDLVQVELTVQSADAMENIVIEDLLPAGLEIENPRLLGNAAGLPVAPHRRPRNTEENNGDNGPVFETIRTDMRDDRLILVGRLTRPGSGTYLYTARAVASGKYVLPPVKAECMYDSGINSLWGAGTFEVLPSGETKVVQARR